MKPAGGFGYNSTGSVTGPRGLDEKFGRMLASISRKVEFLGKWKVSLLTTIAIVTIVIGARSYYSLVTGYIVPDEAYYYNILILDGELIPGYRPVFVAIFVLFFHGVRSVWTFLLIGALYSTIWAYGCILLFFMILRRLKVPERISSLLLLSLPLFPIFTVFTAAILTETLGLFLALLGVYFGLRHMQKGRLADSLLSLVFFLLAYSVREAYLIFALGNGVLFLALSIKRRSFTSLIVYMILISMLFLPVPVRLNPIEFAQPIHAAFGWMPRLVSGLVSCGAWSNSTRCSPTRLVEAVTIGLGYGFNPLFALFAVFSVLALVIDVFRGRSSIGLFLALNMVWSFGAFIVSTAVVLTAFGSGALSGWTSSIIRGTHPLMPSVVGFPNLLRRLKTKRVAGLIIILVILGSTQLGSLASAFQRSLSLEPVDRISLDYRAPYYKMYLLAKDSGNVLIFGGLHWRGIRMYMAMLPNVVLVRSGISATEFRALLERDWDSVFLYDDWYTIEIPSMINAYPKFYAEILRSRQYPGYSVETLWIDGESYALRMIKNNASSGSP